MLSKSEVFLRGKKTHIIAILFIAIGITQFLAGDITLIELLTNPDNWANEGVNSFLGGAALSALRSGIALK